MKFKLAALALLILALPAILSGCSNGANTSIQLGEPFEEPMHTGSLRITVKSAERITDPSRLPPENMCLEYRDDHVLPDGTLKEGSFFVLLDLEVESLDAAVDVGKYDEDDPYEFSADGLLTLVDLTERQGGNYVYIPADYFSLYGQSADPNRVFGFKLMPGEKTEFQLGYFVGKKRDGSERDLTQLRAGTGVSVKSDCVDLKLGEGPDA